MAIKLSPYLSSELEYGRWRTLSDAQRLERAFALGELLAAEGYELEDPQLKRFGPRADGETVAQFRDSRLGVFYSLLPGGPVRVGLDEGGLQELCKRLRAVDCADPSEVYPCGLTERWSPNCLAEGDGVEVAPLLMADAPLRQSLPGLDGVFESRDERLLGFDPSCNRVACLSWTELHELLGRHGWALPTSVEFEWALTAGRRSVFYWGNEFPSSGRGKDFGEFARTILRLEFDEAPSPWPEATRFGMRGMVGAPQWCLERSVEPCVRGGAAIYLPWQGRQEWLWMVNGSAAPLSAFAEPRIHNAVRPVIRLA